MGQALSVERFPPFLLTTCTRVHGGRNLELDKGKHAVIVISQQAVSEHYSCIYMTDHFVHLLSQNQNQILQAVLALKLANSLYIWWHVLEVQE